MATLKDLLPQIPKDELSILRDLNSKLDESKLTEATAKEAAQAVKEIIQNWRGWSKAMLLAMVLTPNISNALETYSPNTLQDIRTEISKDTTDVAKTDPVSKKTLPNALKAFGFSQNFESGKATLSNPESIVSDLKNWLGGKDASKFKIVIFAGESQVTNPKEFSTPGSLAQARAKELEKTANEAGFDKVEINVEIGKTPYKPGDDINDPKYKAEQFVTINIVADNSVCSMQPIKGKGSQGEASKGYVTATEYLSGKGNLEMNTGTIPDRMVVLDANGKITHDTGYIATNKKPGQWTYTPAYVLALTKARIAKSPAMANTKLEVTKPLNGNTLEEKYNDLISQLANTPNPSRTGDEIGPALIEMKKMIAKGVTEFVLYKIEDNIPAKLNFDESQGDVQMKVYSPVGNTGYDISGFCYK
jgi:hypothetical protein